MSEPFSLTTADPLFSPDEPLRVNGYVFVPQAALGTACEIIGQIEPDFRFPPSADSQQRRIERAQKWLAGEGWSRHEQEKTAALNWCKANGNPHLPKEQPTDA